MKGLDTVESLSVEVKGPKVSHTDFGVMIRGFYLGLYLKYAVFEF